MVKIYACKIATNISNPVNIIMNGIGSQPPTTPIIKTNPAITLSKTWPAIKLAASLIDRLTGLARKVKSSMTIINGASQAGVPAGRNNDKNFIPCLIKPEIVTTKKTKKARANVTMMWLVTVKE